MEEWIQFSFSGQQLLGRGSPKVRGVSRFIDEVDIYVRSGDGGPGAVSFRREKYVPKGGPDGGDGGGGGDVIFRVCEEIKTLFPLFMKKHFRARNGRPGSGRNKTGSKGSDCVIQVPAGTVISSRDTGAVLSDLTGENREKIILKGGRGGYGNARFATSVNRAPRFAQEGKPGSELNLTLQIKIIADVGLVGFPNAGKSTLLSVLTDARPKIGQYPFTTLSPNLGVMEYRNELQIIIADVPGLLEGAHKGYGLGIKFLKHVERTKALLLLIDLSIGDFVAQHKALRNELERYSAALLKKPFLTVGTKQDIISTEAANRFLCSRIEGRKMCISSTTRTGIGELKDEIIQIMEMSCEKHLS